MFKLIKSAIRNHRANREAARYLVEVMANITWTPRPWTGTVWVFGR